MTRQIISKTETGERRIDIDDLVALAIALRSTPSRILLTAGAAETELVELMPEVSVSELDAWMWATGEKPLPKGCDAPSLQMAIEDDRERWFATENRPHRPPEAPAGILFRDHPELVRAMTAVIRQALQLGIGKSDLHYALESLYFAVGSGTFREPDGGS